MNIALVGYGRMGKEVEAVSLHRNHDICARIDPEYGDHSAFSPESLKGADGVIEFALPDGLLERVSLASELGIPYVIGTTGWNDKEGELRSLSAAQNASVLFGSNFSIGAQLFFRVVRDASGLINAFSDYDIMLSEYHHRKKKDSPSGTAVHIANQILQTNHRKKRICSAVLQREIEDDELHIASIRGGSIPGIHRVTLDSPADSITLEHSARNRSGFASGAVLGLEWLKGKKGVYSADDFFADIMQ